MNITKTCGNCKHANKKGETYSHCIRVGTYCSTEMLFGGRCAGPKTGIPEMNLWELHEEKPRRTIWMRIAGIFSSGAA